MMSKIKILIVDDEAFNLDIMNEYLTDAGYDVFVAGDGNSALKKLEEVPDFSVILLDRMMPNMDGIQVVNKIKANPKFVKIPVIMQTAAAAIGQQLEGMQAGVFAYISKPYEDIELLDLITQALNEHK